MISPHVFAVALLTQVSGAPIIIHEGDRPTNRAMTYYATCGTNRYIVSARLGAKAEKSITSLAVNGKNINENVVTDRVNDRRIIGDVSSVVIDRCQGGSARVRIEVLSQSPFLSLHLFNFWMSSAGEVSAINEK